MWHSWLLAKPRLKNHCYPCNLDLVASNYCSQMAWASLQTAASSHSPSTSFGYVLQPHSCASTKWHHQSTRVLTPRTLCREGYHTGVRGNNLETRQLLEFDFTFRRCMSSPLPHATWGTIWVHVYGISWRAENTSWCFSVPLYPTLW